MFYYLKLAGLIILLVGGGLEFVVHNPAKVRKEADEIRASNHIRAIYYAASAAYLRPEHADSAKAFYARATGTWARSRDSDDKLGSLVDWLTDFRGLWLAIGVLLFGVAEIAEHRKTLQKRGSATITPSTVTRRLRVVTADGRDFRATVGPLVHPDSSRAGATLRAVVFEAPDGAWMGCTLLPGDRELLEMDRAEIADLLRRANVPG